MGQVMSLQYKKEDVPKLVSRWINVDQTIALVKANMGGGAKYDIENRGYSWETSHSILLKSLETPRPLPLYVVGMEIDDDPADPTKRIVHVDLAKISPDVPEEKFEIRVGIGVKNDNWASKVQDIELTQGNVVRLSFVGPSMCIREGKNVFVFGMMDVLTTLKFDHNIPLPPPPPPKPEPKTRSKATSGTKKKAKARS